MHLTAELQGEKLWYAFNKIIMENWSSLGKELLCYVLVWRALCSQLPSNYFGVKAKGLVQKSALSTKIMCRQNYPWYSLILSWTISNIGKCLYNTHFTGQHIIKCGYAKIWFYSMIVAKEERSTISWTRHPTKATEGAQISIFKSLKAPHTLPSQGHDAERPYV
jgi:hypothetical protein